MQRSNKASRLDYLIPATLSVDQRILYDLHEPLPSEHYDLLLNVFLEYVGFDNVTVIPGCTSVLCKKFRDARKKEIDLQSKGSDDFMEASKIRYNCYKAVIQSIPQKMRKSLLSKRMIVYVNNNGSHDASCIFLFNIRNYIMN